MRYWLMAFCLLSGASSATGDSPPAGAAGHGKSTLTIAVVGPRMTIGLNGPVENFIGFEQPPATPEQTARLARAIGDLRAGDNLFLTPPEADCRMTSAAVSPPRYADQAGTRPVDLKASWEFRCSNPAALMWVEAQVLARFPGTAQLVTSARNPFGQKSVVLTPGTPRVLLPRSATTRD